MQIGDAGAVFQYFCVLLVVTDGHGGAPPGGGIKIDFRKTSFLSFLWRNFFRRFQGGSPRVKKDRVNLTFNEFLNRKFASRYMMVPRGGSKRGSVNLDLTCFFYYHFSPPMCFGRRGGPPPRGSSPLTPPLCPPMWCAPSLRPTATPMELDKEIRVVEGQ